MSGRVWAAAAVWLAVSATAFGQSNEELLETIKKVGPEGKGNAEASVALAKLTARGKAVLPEILVAFDGANPLAENWLRAGFEAVADQTLKNGGTLSAKSLEAFVDDRDNHAEARRLAYEWLVKVDGDAADRILPGALTDPSAEMRREAVARVIAEAKTKEGEAAVAAWQKALSGAVHKDQVDEITEALAEQGMEIDLPQHFGFLTSWQLVGPFDNREGIGFAASYPPEQGIDLAASYDSNYPAAEGKVGWQKVATDDDYGVLDIAKQIENHKGSVFYATTTFLSEKGGPVQVRLGTSNAWKLWLNGEQVFAREEYHRGTSMDQYRVDVELKPGVNRLLLKVCQNEQTQEWAQRYQFQLRVCDPAGSAVLADEKGGQ